MYVYIYKQNTGRTALTLYTFTDRPPWCLRRTEFGRGGGAWWPKITKRLREDARRGVAVGAIRFSAQNAIDAAVPSRQTFSLARGTTASAPAPTTPDRAAYIAVAVAAVVAGQAVGARRP